MENALGEFCTVLSRELTAANDAASVEDMLRITASFFFPGHLLAATEGEEVLPLCKAAERCLEAAKLESSGDDGEARALLRRALFQEPYFSTVANVLLYHVTPDWLPSLGAPARAALFDAFFLAAPAGLLLTALLPALTLVPGEGRRRKGGASMQEQAERILALCLVAPREHGLPGVKQMALCCADQAAREPLARGAAARAGSRPDAAGAAGRRRQQDAARLAAELASVPDRVSPAAPADLRAPRFVPAALRQVLEAIEDHSSWRSGAEGGKSDAGTDAAGSGGSPAASAAAGVHLFAGELMTRFCRRGHAGAVAAELLSAITADLRRPPPPDTVNQAPEDSLGVPAVAAAANQGAAPQPGAASSGREDAMLSEGQGGGRRGPRSEQPPCDKWHPVAAAVRDPHALRRLAEALLLEMARKAGRSAGASCGCHVSAERGPGDAEAVEVLHVLFGRLIWTSGAVRHLFISHLLLQALLPLRCLSWVLSFAVVDPPPPPLRRGSAAMALPPVPPDAPGARAGNGAGAGAARAGPGPGQVAREETLREVVTALMEAWSAPAFVRSQPLGKQAYVSAGVALCVSAMTRRQLEAAPGLLPGLLAGVSTRLDSPLPEIRTMGQRVAFAFSTVIDPQNPLLFEEEAADVKGFHDWDTLLPGGTGRGTDPGAAGPGEAPGKDQGTAAQQQAGASSDRVLERGAADGEGGGGPLLEAYDMQDDESDLESESVPRQLRRCAEALRKSDDSAGAEAALGAVGGLIRAWPDELDDVAGELARALVYLQCHAVAVEGEEDAAEAARHAALVALLARSPDATMAVLLKAVFSASSDISQRLLVLAVMTEGARELAASRLSRPTESRARHLAQVAGRGHQPLVTELADEASPGPWHAPSGSHTPPGAGPWSLAPGPLSSAVTSLGSHSAAAPSPQGGLGSWSQRYQRDLPSRTRAKGATAPTSLAGGAAPAAGPRPNGFARHAAAFMLPLMRGHDAVSHGVDWPGRDFVVLARMLHLLGTCVECVGAGQPELPPLAAALLDLLQARHISWHPEAFVRRAALFAASRIPPAISPAYAVAALSGADPALAEGLQWIAEWARQVADSDPDDSCCTMALLCLQEHAELASRAMAHLQLSQMAPAPASLLQSAKSGQPLIAPI